MDRDLFSGLELKAEVKEVKEDGTFTGIASTYGDEDLTGDVIDRGAFKKTLAENPEVPILFFHNAEEVIGVGTVKEWQSKILIEGKLDIEDEPAAQKAYRRMKRGRTKSLSIGFKTIKATWEEREEEGRTRYIRHIQELKLYEVSVVQWGANPNAQVTRVKTAEEQRLEDRVAQLENDLKALQAANATPAQEPAKAEEPPPTVQHEPEAIHSALKSLLDSIKEN